MPNVGGLNRLFIERLTDPDFLIPVLPNGQSRSGFVGHLTEVWQPRATLDLTLTYSSLDGRRAYRESVSLLLANDLSFTGLSLRIKDHD